MWLLLSLLFLISSGGLGQPITPFLGQVNVEVSPAGAGTVSVTPPASSVTDGTYWYSSPTYKSPTTVQLQATANSGWAFSHWQIWASVPASGNPETREDYRTTVTLTSAQPDWTVRAVFVQTYTLRVNKTGEGTVKVNGQSVTLPYEATFPAGTTLTLEAVPAQGWQFSQWQVNGSTLTQPTIQITMDADKSATATFTQILYTLRVNKTGEGTVKVNGQSVTLPYEATFPAGTTLTLEAVPAQ
ncbi:MAG: hypothetical protein QW356_08960, partial [Candidatus Hadarchaeales archaeon]